MKWQKLVIYFSISLFLISCGKKKEAAKSEAPPPAAPATPAPAPAENKPAPNSPVVVNPGDKAKDKAGKKSGSATGRDKSITRDRKATQDKSEKKNGSSSSASKGEKPSSGAAPGFKLEQHKPLKSASLTGGETNFGLLYTGSSEDGVLAKLIELESQKPAAQALKDKELAISLLDLSYLVDRTGQITIDLTMVVGGKTTDKRFQMPYAAEKLMSARDADLKISAECIDAYKYSDDCSNILVTVDKGAASAKAILRQTKAELGYEYEVSAKEDSEYSALTQFLKNSKLDFETDNRMEKSYLNTFEVVGGKSAFTAVIMGKAKQVLAFKSDLLINKDLSAPLNQVDKVTDWNDINLFMTANGKDLKFMELFKSASLAANNGKGQITVSMIAESKLTKSKNKVLFQFSRKGVATRF